MSNYLEGYSQSNIFFRGEYSRFVSPGILPEGAVSVSLEIHDFERWFFIGSDPIYLETRDLKGSFFVGRSSSNIPRLSLKFKGYPASYECMKLSSKYYRLHVLYQMRARGVLMIKLPSNICGRNHQYQLALLPRKLIWILYFKNTKLKRDNLHIRITWDIQSIWKFGNKYLLYEDSSFTNKRESLWDFILWYN